VGAALPAARALARRLGARNLAAAATGAVCRVTLTGGDDAPREAWRAVTAAAGQPTVLALPAREAAWDAFLGEADRLVLAPPAGAGAEYVDAAAASLAVLGPPVDRVAPPEGAVARRAAALGLLRLRPVAIAVPA
jgi:hypothetical protein